MGLFERIQSKLELYRLEQRYTRRRNRTTYGADAVYVNGEYVFHNSPTSNLRSSSPSSSSTPSPSSVTLPTQHAHTQSAPVSHRPSMRQRPNPRYTFDDSKASTAHRSNYSINYTPTDYESADTGSSPRRDGKPYYSTNTTVTGGGALPQRRASKRASVMDGSWIRKSAGMGVKVRELVVPDRARY
ncbi:MAG: hypothetical protein M1819_005754 [Sarea resinae]|nr:MAG: hypothetical protein M1819_005754 [Sarea resinae]